MKQKIIIVIVIFWSSIAHAQLKEITKSNDSSISFAKPINSMIAGVKNEIAFLNLLFKENLNNLEIRSEHSFTSEGISHNQIYLFQA